MSKSGAWVWAFYIGMSVLMSLSLGLALGYILFSPNAANIQLTRGGDPAEVQTQTPQAAPALPESIPPTEPTPIETVLPAAAVAVTPEAQEAPDAVQAARHLFIAVNGQWLAEGTRNLLRELKPGGVVLRPANIASGEQTRALINEIKVSSGMGSLFSDLPMVAINQDGSQNNVLRIEGAVSSADIGLSNDVETAQQLGRQYGSTAKSYGINIIFGPVLDVYDPATAFPNLKAQSFGANQTQVAALGLAMAQGLRSGGVIAVAKSFPGYAAAGYGADGISVVMNQDFNSLAKSMYPFSEAARGQMEGIMVGHIAVPTLDVDNPTRSAALSPIMIAELLRNRWKFQGVIIGDEVAFNEMTRAYPAERAVVEALIAGCDAVVFLDPSPTRIQSVVDSIERAVEQGELTIEQLDASKARLEAWRTTLGAIAPIPEEPVDTQVALLQEIAGGATTAPSLPAIEAPTVAPVPESAKPVAEMPEVTVETPVAESVVSEVAAQTSAEPQPTPEPPVTMPEVPAEELIVAKEEAEAVEAPPTPEPTTSPEPAESSSKEEVSKTIDNIAKAVDDTTLNHVQHTIKEGESILQIAWDYDVTTEDILRWNSLESMSVEPGTVLDIYTAKTMLAVEKTEEPSTPEPDATEEPVDPVEADDDGLEERMMLALTEMNDAYQKALTRAAEKKESSPSAVTEETPPVVPPVPEPETPESVPVEEPMPADPPVTKPVTPPGKKTVHLVKWGDTLTSVANDYSVSIADIRAWNALKGDTLKANSSLVIYTESPTEETQNEVESPPDSPETEKSEATIYVVQSGDTISKIAREHNTTLKALLTLNDLDNANSIIVGQKLKVPTIN